MKILLTTFCLLVFNVGFSQDVLFFKNGSSQKGKVVEIYKATIRFKAEGSKKIKKYKDDKIEKAMIKSDGTCAAEGIDIEYTVGKIPLRGLGKVFLGKIFSSEKINLYVCHKYVAGGKDRTGFYVTGGIWDFYFSKKEDEKDYFQLGLDGALVNKFKNRASKYFNDCPKLSAKIKTQKLGVGNMIEICEYYNSPKCH